MVFNSLGADTHTHTYVRTYRRFQENDFKKPSARGLKMLILANGCRLGATIVCIYL